MHIDRIMEIRPKDRSAAAVKAAIAELELERVAADASLAAMVERRGSMLVSASRKELEASEKELRLTQESLAQIDAFLAALRADLPEIERQEGIDKLNAELVDLRVEEKAQAFAAWWNTKYESLARQLAEGFQLEAEAYQAFWTAAQYMKRRADELGAVIPAYKPPAMFAIPGGIMVPKLGDLVVLPGMLGAPAHVGVVDAPIWEKPRHRV